jgi:hypothetical protein
VPETSAAAAMRMTSKDAMPDLLHDQEGRVWRKSTNPACATRYYLTDAKGKVIPTTYKEYVELTFNGYATGLEYSPEADAEAIAEIHKRVWPLADQTAGWLQDPSVQMHLQRAIKNTNSLCFVVNHEACALELTVGFHLPKASALVKLIKFLRLWFTAYGAPDVPVCRVADAACIVINRDGSNLRVILNLVDVEAFFKLSGVLKLLDNYPREFVEGILLHLPDGEVVPFILFKAYIHAVHAIKTEFLPITSKVTVEKAPYGLKVLLPFSTDLELSERVLQPVRDYETLSGQSVIYQHLSYGVHLQDREAASLVDIALAIKDGVVKLAPGTTFKAVAKIRYEGVVLVESTKTKGRYRQVLSVQLTSSGQINDLTIGKFLAPFRKSEYDLVVAVSDCNGNRTLGDNLVATRRRLRL